MRITHSFRVCIMHHVPKLTASPCPLVVGWYEGERLRDGERGWFLAECAERITCQAAIERNWQRMDRLQGLETNV